MRLEEFLGIGTSHFHFQAAWSCGFKAFQRDMDLLTGGGGATPQRRWKCIHVEGHVLFPGSDHVETLAIFERLLS